MATRREVREAFYSELETAASSLVDADNIVQGDPDKAEAVPAIAHRDLYREVPMNMGGNPVSTNSANGGDDQKLVYAKQMQARFRLTILAQSEQDKEDIYETVRQHFERYETPVENPSSIQADVHDVSVGDADADDSTDRGPPLRGDVVTVSLTFQRFYSSQERVIEDVTESYQYDSNWIQ